MTRKVVLTRNEYVDFVHAQNNKTNVYTTVYDFREFSEKTYIDSSVIRDRIFLDFDAHEEDIESAWRDLKIVMELVHSRDYLHTFFFSGRGFHLFIYGEETENMRNVQTLFHEIKKYLISRVGENNTLDDRVGQHTRLRRVPNTVNMSSSDENGNPYFCIPLIKKDLSLTIQEILDLAKQQRMIPFEMSGKTKAIFPKAPPIQAMKGEVSVPSNIGSLPMLPCLHSAVMVENPSHISRAYLVAWYRDLISGYQNLESVQDKQKTLNLVVDELERVFAKSEDVWLDWDKNETKKHAKFTVFGNYNAPHCNKLISEGFCIGKCWRYHDVDS